MRSRSLLYTVNALPLTLLAGCPSSSSIPDQLDVALTLAEKQNAAADTGPEILADGTWKFFREDDTAAAVKLTATAAADSPLGPYGGLLNGGALERPPVGEQIFRVAFAEDGRLVRVAENKFFFPDIYGVEFPVGVGVWNAPFPGLTTNSASFGLSVGNRYGVAAFIDARVLGVHIADAVLYSWGTIADDRLDGTFGYQIDFSSSPIGLLLKTGGDQYPVFATRE